MMSVEINPDLDKVIFSGSEIYSDEESVSREVIAANVSVNLMNNAVYERVLQVRANVYKVDHVMIVKAPVMAVSTEAGFTSEKLACACVQLSFKS